MFTVIQTAWAVDPVIGEHEEFLNRWKEVQIGMPLDMTIALLVHGYESIGVTNMDGTGYMAYWSVSDQLKPAEEMTYTSTIPFVDVYIIYFNEQSIIVEKSQDTVAKDELHEKTQRY